MGILNNQSLFPANTVLNQNLHSQAMALTTTYNVSLSVFFTSTVNGTFYLEVSNDPGPFNGQPSQLPTHWQTLPNSTFTVSTGGDCGWNYEMSGFEWVRISFTDASGGSSTGVITAANINGK